MIKTINLWTPALYRFQPRNSIYFHNVKFPVNSFFHVNAYMIFAF